MRMRHVHVHAHVHVCAMSADGKRTAQTPAIRSNQLCGTTSNAHEQAVHSGKHHVSQCSARLSWLGSAVARHTAQAQPNRGDDGGRQPSCRVAQVTLPPATCPHGHHWEGLSLMLHLTCGKQKGEEGEWKGWRVERHEPRKGPSDVDWG